MPVPGPRNQFRPLSGHTNPSRETPDRINRWKRPGPVVLSGRSPGTMTVTLRGNVLAPGQIRRLWRQAVNYVSPQEPYSWTHSAPSPGRPTLNPPGYFITTALRYMTRSVYVAGGTDNSRYSNLHTTVRPRVRSKPVSIPAGAVRSRPTVRNRLTSFGSRVQPLNTNVPGAQ